MSKVPLLFFWPTSKNLSSVKIFSISFFLWSIYNHLIYVLSRLQTLWCLSERQNRFMRIHWVHTILFYFFKLLFVSCPTSQTPRVDRKLSRLKRLEVVIGVRNQCHWKSDFFFFWSVVQKSNILDSNNEIYFFDKTHILSFVLFFSFFLFFLSQYLNCFQS